MEGVTWLGDVEPAKITMSTRSLPSAAVLGSALCKAAVDPDVIRTRHTTDQTCAKH